MDVKTQEEMNDWDRLIRQSGQQKEQKVIETLESITAKAKSCHISSELSQAGTKGNSIKDTINFRENTGQLAIKSELLAVHLTHLTRIINEKYVAIHHFLSNHHANTIVYLQKGSSLLNFLRRISIEGQLIRITTSEFQQIISQFQYLLDKSIKNFYKIMPQAQKNEYKIIAADNRSLLSGRQKARKNISALSMLKLDLAFLFILADYEYQHLYVDKGISKLTYSCKFYKIFDINEAQEKVYQKTHKIIEEMFDLISLELYQDFDHLVVILCMVKIAYKTSVLSEEIRQECIRRHTQPQEIKLLGFSYKSLEHKRATNTIAFRFCEIAKLQRRNLASPQLLAFRKFLILDELRQIPLQITSFEKRRILIRLRLHYSVPLSILCTWSQQFQSNPRLHQESLEKIKIEFEPYKWFYFHTYSDYSPFQSLSYLGSFLSEQSILFLGLSLITCERLKIYNSIIDAQMSIARRVRKHEPILIYKTQFCSNDFLGRQLKEQVKGHKGSDQTVTLIIAFQGRKLIFAYTVKGQITSHEYATFLERLLEAKTSLRDTDLIIYDKNHESKMSKRQIIMKLVNKFNKLYNIFVYLTSDIKYFKRHFLFYYLIVVSIRASTKSISEGDLYDKVRQLASKVIRKLTNT